MFASNKAYPTLRKNAGRKNRGFIASSDWDPEAFYLEAFSDEFPESLFEEPRELINRFRIHQAGKSKARDRKGGMV